MKIDMEDDAIRIWAITKEEEALLQQLFPDSEDAGEGVTLWMADGIVAFRTRLNRAN